MLLFPVERIVIATHNKGKLSEFRSMLQPYMNEIFSAGELGLPSPEETGTTCEDNARLKVKAAAQALTDGKSLIIADDSGLFINALGGNPGVYAADWVRPNLAAGLKRVQDELGQTPDRSAYFMCVLALYWPNGQIDMIKGKVNGTIARTQRGREGHDYDPLFIPEGSTRTFAEMSDEEKNMYSHRGQATKALIHKLFTP